VSLRILVSRHAGFIVAAGFQAIVITSLFAVSGIVATGIATAFRILATRIATARVAAALRIFATRITIAAWIDLARGSVTSLVLRRIGLARPRLAKYLTTAGQRNCQKRNRRGN